MGPKGLLGLVCAASLTAGAGIGVVLDRTALRTAHAAAKAGEGEYVARVVGRLGLDARQEKTVRAIFERRRPQFLEILKRVRPDLQALHEETDAEIRKI